ncbi:hypothetical protein B0H11DRAFT_2292900 [Mycena galericulata]|nr:hypothetical protein B0H11DRAFT_2292900 [Mycena galericulata]
MFSAFISLPSAALSAQYRHPPPRLPPHALDIPFASRPSSPILPPSSSPLRRTPSLSISLASLTSLPALPRRIQPAILMPSPCTPCASLSQSVLASDAFAETRRVVAGGYGVDVLACMVGAERVETHDRCLLVAARTMSSFPAAPDESRCAYAQGRGGGSMERWSVCVAWTKRLSSMCCEVFSTMMMRMRVYVLYPIIGALRKANQIILLSASSAFAAKSYPGGRTTHYLYGIPVDEYNPHLKSSVDPHSDRAKLLQAAKCHVIDEIGGMHFKAFDCADRLTRSLTGCTIMFGEDVAPVAVFQHFEIIKLEASIRQRGDPAFSAFLDAIGDDYHNDSVYLGALRHTHSALALINFVFPPSVVADPGICISRAILSPFNAFVD